MSPCHEDEASNTSLTQATSMDFEQLCRLDVLGLVGSSANDQDVVHSEVKEQLIHHPHGYYQTGLPWKGSHPPLPTNKSGSLKGTLSWVGMRKNFHSCGLSWTLILIALIFLKRNASSL